MSPEAQLTNHASVFIPQCSKCDSVYLFHSTKAAGREIVRTIIIIRNALLRCSLIKAVRVLL